MSTAARHERLRFLVGTVRSGPPTWSSMRLDAVDRAANTIEVFVHHEDLRRVSEPWEPKKGEPAAVEAMRSTGFGV